MSGKIPITRNGLEKMKEEVKRLKKEERPKVIQAIAEARAHGDISENAEYEAAKERQSHVEGRIKWLEDRIARANVIDTANHPKDRVIFGVTVSLEDLDNGEKIKYTIVGEDEADVDNGSISVTSPIARALIGKQIDDTAKVITPAGVREFMILEIS
ncbi:MAG TPA: transcription elongation factor GreA [Nitrospinae bacterium]|nr:transcription elongation factor GreA [Nitrospinota bacterium]HBA26016.1 transcription elongation factor GreA [Nitrospinota bacterium]